MDILTQGLLGAAMAQTVAQPKEARQAMIIGFFSGLLADLDVLIQSSTDALLMLEYHRHFTHSIFFIPLGALIAALLLWPFFRKSLSFARLYLFAVLGFSLSGFIDTCTSYGTYLFWPLYDERISLNIISVLDPVFTVVLMIAVLIAVFKRQARFAKSGLIFCTCYLLLGTFQHYQAQSLVLALAQNRGHVIERAVIKPTMGNLVLWRSSYISNDEIHVDAIRVGLVSEPIIYEGSSLPVFKPERDLINVPKDSRLYQDVMRFKLLVDGYIALHPQQPELLGDIRYSMLPTSTDPLWAVTLNLKNHDKHVNYDFYRKNDSTLRQRFMDMLLGKPGIY
ncbi:MAG: metal-dependent hydrolase [Gammaproteobacteria bacterium]|nr:metal-dependent hydrolase [Gammaproteobacteria bacterium]